MSLCVGQTCILQGKAQNRGYWFDNPLPHSTSCMQGRVGFGGVPGTHMGGDRDEGSGAYGRGIPKNNYQDIITLACALHEWQHLHPCGGNGFGSHTKSGDQET